MATYASIRRSGTDSDHGAESKQTSFDDVARDGTRAAWRHAAKEYIAQNHWCLSWWLPLLLALELGVWLLPMGLPSWYNNVLVMVPVALAFRTAASAAHTKSLRTAIVQPVALVFPSLCSAFRLHPRQRSPVRFHLISVVAITICCAAIIAVFFKTPPPPVICTNNMIGKFEANAPGVPGWVQCHVPADDYARCLEEAGFWRKGFCDAVMVLNNFRRSPFLLSILLLPFVRLSHWPSFIFLHFPHFPSFS